MPSRTRSRHDGWQVIVDARDADRLLAATDRPGLVGIPGDVADEWHRGCAHCSRRACRRLDLLVHNASTLGPTPLPHLAATVATQAQEVWATNVGAPTGADRRSPARPRRRRAGTLLSISSDAGVEHYEGWGLYGASKAALDHLTLTFGAENPAIRAYAVDPGDMRTAMHQAAFPGEDISDRPLPETVVPHLLALLERDHPPAATGRWTCRSAERIGG